MRLQAILLVLGIASVGTGCSSSRHEATEKYYLVAANVKLPYWLAAQSGLNRAAKQLSVQVEMVGPDTYDPQAEKQAFANAVSKKPSGILISASDAKMMTADIDAAIAAGIPVIAMDSDAPGSKRLAFIGTDNHEAGLIGGKVLMKALAGKSNVVVFSMPGQANLEERLHGYRDAGIKVDQVVDIKGDPRIAFDKATELLTKKDVKVDAFVCLEASACKEVAEVVSRNKVTGKPIIAMDTDKETLEGIQKGLITATIAQKPFTMAFYGLKMLDDLHHNPVSPLDKAWSQDSFSPIPEFVNTGATLIDKSNVDEFLRARDAANAK